MPGIISKISNFKLNISKVARTAISHVPPLPSWAVITPNYKVIHGNSPLNKLWQFYCLYEIYFLATFHGFFLTHYTHYAEHTNVHSIYQWLWVWTCRPFFIAVGTVDAIVFMPKWHIFYANHTNTDSVACVLRLNAAELAT